MKNKPFIKLYRSPRGFYFYDVNRDTIVGINERIYDYLSENCPYEELGEEDKEYVEHLLEKGYLSDKRISEIKHEQTDEIEEILSSRCQQLILQVTQLCNLVCSYCPYANKTDNVLQRNHENKHMSWEVAKKAIDFFAEHSSAYDSPSISFYGGEPLIEFELLKKCVEYSEELFLGKNLSFFMTTNATLMSDEIIDFLAEHDFKLLISIDGPASIHDINRKRSDGTGSFASAFEALKKAYKRYGDNAANGLEINMVLAPDNDIDEAFSLFDDEFFRNNSVGISSSVADDEYLEYKLEYPNEFIAKYNYYFFLAFLKTMKLVEGIDIPAFYNQSMFILKRNYLRYKRGMNSLPDIGCPGGPCVPGHSKFFVNVYGDMFPCERVSEISKCMKVGSIYNGFDYDAIKKQMNVSQQTADKCRECYAQLHCSLCQGYSDGGDELVSEKRAANCKRSCSRFDSILKTCILFKETKTHYTWRP